MKRVHGSQAAHRLAGHVVPGRKKAVFDGMEVMQRYLERAVAHFLALEGDHVAGRAPGHVEHPAGHGPKLPPSPVHMQMDELIFTDIATPSHNNEKLDQCIDAPWTVLAADLTVDFALDDAHRPKTFEDTCALPVNNFRRQVCPRSVLHVIHHMPKSAIGTGVEQWAA